MTALEPTTQTLTLRPLPAFAEELPPPGDPQRHGFWFGVSCPRCGSELTPEATSRPTDLGTHVTAVVSCTAPPCRTRWQVTTRMTPFRHYEPHG